MDDGQGIGRRVREARKRKGLTQAELAVASGLSISLVTKLESGAVSGVRLETVHRLAAVLRVPTSDLASGPDAPDAAPDTADEWRQVRDALDGGAGGSDDEPTIGGVRDGLSAAVGAALASRHGDLRVMLPALMRDADALVGLSVDGAQVRARQARSEIRQLAGYILGQVRQFAAAARAIDLATQDAPDDLTAMAAGDWKCWILLRQGRLAESRALAERWVRDAEPRMLTASRDELAAWGRFLIRLSAAAVRDNRPDESRDALRLARMAAAGTGNDFILPWNSWQVFGPLTVAMIGAENAAVQDRPETTLALGSHIAGRVFPVPRNFLRHRLDVAHALAATRQDARAVSVLREIRAAAPEWLAQQRYAGDTLSSVIRRRRVLSEDMRELAEFLRLPL